MKIKACLIVALSAGLFMGSAVAAESTSKRNQQKAQSQKTQKVEQKKVKASASDREFARTVDMNYDDSQTGRVHPIFRTRMGNH